MIEDILQSEFIHGTPDQSLSGFYKGELVRLFPDSLTETIGSLLINIWLPWKGKFFYPQQQLGDNIVSPALKFFIKFLYNDWSQERNSDGKFHVFPFKTSIAQGLKDSVNVLQLNYNLPQNPAAVRNVVDELVRIDAVTYLGKAYLIKNNIPRLVAYFRLHKVDMNIH